METIVLVIIGLIAVYMSFTFVVIPRNHIVCVEIGGGFQHLLAHSDDKIRIYQAIKQLPDSVINDSAKYGKILENYNNIITRDTWLDNSGNLFILPLLVKLFNLHLKSWIPWASLRQIKVVKTRINSGYSQGAALSEKISYDKADHKPEETDKLRIDLPRVGYLPEIELEGNIKVDMVWGVSKITVFNPFDVFYHNNEISSWIDFQVNQGMVNFMGQKSFEKFQKENLTSDPSNEFNKYFKEKNPPKSKKGNAGIVSIGVIITGEISIVDWQLGKEQEKLVAAKLAAASANANLEAAQKEAQGKAAITREEGLAAADAILAKGKATAEATKALKKAIHGDPLIAEVLRTQAYGGNVTTIVNGAGTGVIIQPKP